MSNLNVTITSWGAAVLDKSALRKVMRAAGNDVKTKTARLIAQSTGTGRAYYGGGGAAYRGSYVNKPYRASAPGDPPVRVSNALRSSLKTYVYPSAEGFAVRERQFYALFLEAGARGGGNRFGGRPALAKAWRNKGKRHRARGQFTKRVLLPRPHLDRVMAQEEKALTARVQRALDQGLTWKQAK